MTEPLAGSAAVRVPRNGRRAARAWQTLRLGAVLGVLLACAAPALRPPPREPLWRDPDRRPFAAELTPYESPHDYDRAEKTFILPVIDVLTVRERTEAVNVNALDEVPDSSWYENRLSRSPMPPDAAALGACGPEPVPEDGTWRVVSAKPHGVTPGFVFEAAGQRYYAKLDGAASYGRSSLADVVCALIYHAAGYHVPCNAIAHFDPATLELDPSARARTPSAGRRRSRASSWRRSPGTG